MLLFHVDAPFNLKNMGLYNLLIYTSIFMHIPVCYEKHEAIKYDNNIIICTLDLV